MSNPSRTRHAARIMPKLVWRRRRGWVALALAIAGFGIAVALLLTRTERGPTHVTTTAGVKGTTRSVIGEALAAELVARGIDARLVATRATEEQVSEVEAGRTDFALVSGTYRLDRHPRLREATPLHVEAFHLLVKAPLADGVLFLWQWRRRRDAAARDETFGTYLLRVVDVERRVATLELADTLDLEALAALQREVLELKQEALERFAAGDLGDQAALSDLLTPLNAARDHIAELILHVRGTLEIRAKAEGRSAEALWAEAIEEQPEGEPT